MRSGAYILYETNTPQLSDGVKFITFKATSKLLKNTEQYLCVELLAI